MNGPSDEYRGPSFPEGANPFRDNPYASPAAVDSGNPFRHAAADQQGKVHHVRIVAILMVIQGVLEVLMGMLLLATAVGLPIFMAMDEEWNNRNPDIGGRPDEFARVFLVIYGGMGLTILAAATLRIVAGIRNYFFRGRGLGLVALAAGMVTLLSCYCAPTAVGLGVYGLIVYLDPAVVEAFATGSGEQVPSGRQNDFE